METVNGLPQIAQMTQINLSNLRNLWLKLC